MSARPDTVRNMFGEPSQPVRRARPRPLSRRIGAVVSGLAASSLTTVMVVYLFLLPFAFAHGPDVRRVWAALLTFGSQLDEGAVEFQGIVLGVLGALFIGRILAPVADVKHEQAINIGTAFAGHILASFVTATALFAAVGVANHPKNAGHVWFLVLLTFIAYALAWAIDAGITITRKRQRRRTRASLVATSWRVHRYAARLLGVRGARARPGRRALAAAIGTVLVAAGCSALTIMVLIPVQFTAIEVAEVVIGALAVATWSTGWVSYLISSTEPGGTWFTPAAIWALTVLSTLVPAVGIAFVPANPEAAAVKAGILIAAAVPFAQVLVPVSVRFSLRGALVAAQLRRCRVRRLVLLRDWYALRKKRRPLRQSAGDWEAQLRAALSPKLSTDDLPVLPSPASLRRHRPSDGTGSGEWWDAAGQPRTFPPLREPSAWWARR